VRRRLPPQALRDIQRSSPAAPKATLGSVSCACMLALHVEFAKQRTEYGILFIFSLFCEYSNLEYVRVPVIYRVNQAEYVIQIRVAASQE